MFDDDDDEETSVNVVGGIVRSSLDFISGNEVVSPEIDQESDP